MNAQNWIERVGRRPWGLGWLTLERWPVRVHVVLGLVVPMLVLAINMWAVHTYTVDDAYISFRYAVNLADGHGLVYNPGERVEGYTNFLWTVLVAGGIAIGIDPHVTTKVMGALAAVATLVVVYRLSEQLSPYRSLPCVATWLLASSATFSGYAMFGLETTAFVFLITSGVLLLVREHARGRGFPWSGLVFAAAGLVRPEAPLFLGTAMLLLGRGAFGRQNLVRGLVFVLPVATHLLWRHAYYGEWLPTTFTAKTGDLAAQWKSGNRYVRDWIEHVGPAVLFSCYGFALGVVRRQRETVIVAALFAVAAIYVMFVGGDWMTYFRFMAPAEPWAFVLCCVGIRGIFDTRDPAARLALALCVAWLVPKRIDGLEKAHKQWLREEKKFWDSVAGQTAEWLAREPPGRIAIGDIGYVGYRTNYPLLDLLGLVDPVIAKLPGGYTKKHGDGYKDRFFGVMPTYVVIIMAGQECDRATMAGSKLLFYDPRFKRNYEVAHNVQVAAKAGWCVFRRKGAPRSP